MLLDDFTQTVDTPNVKIPLNEFCGILKTSTHIKCPYVSLHCYPKGVVFSASMDSGVSASSKKWGDISESKVIQSQSTGSCLVINENQVTHRTIKIPNDIIKGLIKTNNLNNNGIVRIYNEYDVVLRLHFKIGTYGELLCIIQEPDQIQTTGNRRGKGKRK